MADAKQMPNQHDFEQNNASQTGSTAVRAVQSLHQRVDTLEDYRLADLSQQMFFRYHFLRAQYSQRLSYSFSFLHSQAPDEIIPKTREWGDIFDIL